MTVRVGHIGFLNCYPLYHGLDQRGILADAPDLDRQGRPGIELLPGVPTDLNRWLIQGDIDLGPISSIAYARNHRQLLLSRHLSISSLGAVDSIQLVTRRTLREIRSVALTRQSATSVSLLKTILKLRFGQEVLYGELSSSVSEALQEYDAALLIGDQGLEALTQKPSTSPEPPRWKDGGYIDHLPKDPWGHPYQFLSPGQRGGLDIFSLGADGQLGGSGVDADIGNWNLDE